MKYAFLLLFVLSNLFVFAQEKVKPLINNQLTSKHVQIGTSNCYLIVPETYEQLLSQSGVIKNQTGLVVLEIPNPLTNEIGREQLDHFKNPPKEGVKRTELNVQDFKGILEEQHIEDGGTNYKVIQLIFGDSLMLVSLFGMIPVSDISGEQEIVGMLNGLVFNKKAFIHLQENSPYSLPDTDPYWVMSGEMNGAKIYTNGSLEHYLEESFLMLYGMELPQNTQINSYVGLSQNLFKFIEDKNPETYLTLSEEHKIPIGDYIGYETIYNVKGEQRKMYALELITETHIICLYSRFLPGEEKGLIQFAHLLKVNNK